MEHNLGKNIDGTALCGEGMSRSKAWGRGQQVLWNFLFTSKQCPLLTQGGNTHSTLRLGGSGTDTCTHVEHLATWVFCMASLGLHKSTASHITAVAHSQEDL